ncbi:MAG: hypothetical protein QOK15_3682 [Nocardioidaceae bacterium]|nr:hypothetical protein [Nocardioidaceae bacterium]
MTGPPATQPRLPADPPRTLLVLGGSSPYTLALVDAMSQRPPWQPGVLRLHGRDAQALAVVRECAEGLLREVDWTVEAVDDLHAAVDGVDVVLHQNRYGGLRWRARDERLATAMGLPVDETLGPAGLCAALRTAVGQARYADALARGAPRARVLTLTNPLGVSTALLARCGVETLGLCELPELTRQEAAAAAGVPAEELAGCYTGLNHRGFWHHLRNRRGDDLLPVITGRLDAGAARLAGADSSTVRRLRAVPDKYHPLLRGKGHLRPGRAAELQRLRQRALADARHRPDVVPRSLAGRPTPWYEVVVLPALRALTGAPHTLVVCQAAADGIAEEHLVELEGKQRSRLPGRPPPAPVGELLERLRVHERAVLDAARSPGPVTVRRALALDPTVPPQLVAAAAAKVLEDFDAWCSEASEGGAPDGRGGGS